MIKDKKGSFFRKAVSFLGINFDERERHLDLRLTFASACYSLGEKLDVRTRLTDRDPYVLILNLPIRSTVCR